MDVLTKFASASAATRHTSISVCSPARLSNAADSTMTFKTVSGTAARTATMSALTASKSPAIAAPTSITMSTSSAPAGDGERGLLCLDLRKVLA